MGLPSWITIDLFLFFMLLFPLIEVRRGTVRESSQCRYFTWMSVLALLLLFGEVLSQLSIGGSLYPAVLGSFLVSALNAMEFVIWMLYASSWIHAPRHRMRPYILREGCCFFLQLHLLLVGLGRGYFPWFDVSGSFAGGAYFLIQLLPILSLAAFGELYLISFRKKINTFIRRQLMLSLLFPLLGGTLSVFFQDLPLELMGAVCMVQFIYTFVQNQDANTDFLTGIANRRLFDLRIEQKVRKAMPGCAFSAITMDIDGFKQINDTYGHGQGDAALQSLASILISCFRQDDTVARSGGDEFCILLDVAREDTLCEAVSRVRKRLAHFNEKNEFPFNLEISAGYAVYDPNRGETAAEFMNYVDQLMYEDKHKRCKSRDIGKIENQIENRMENKIENKAEAIKQLEQIAG